METKSRKPATARQWREWRESQLMSQRQFALALGVALRTVKYVEAGNHRPTQGNQMRFLQLVMKHKQEKKARRVHGA